jgi:hypothetical protein
MRLTNFGEGDELASSSAGLVDEVDGLANTALKIEPLDVVSCDWVVEVVVLTPGSEVTAAALYLVIAMMKVFKMVVDEIDVCDEVL